ncbi:RNA polymerase sigma factor [Actinoplanes bogorensis]|uniref:RNA polymerase sigma factor n=2 Tax=Paractinoplanes bogorensis TaxID=1610840 RepID=A0ABS5Z0V4_9ACTN|nr:RNA polymerase sigma factor [Actinoplanes bogorensis]
MVVPTTSSPPVRLSRAEADGFEAFYRVNADRVYRALAVTLRRDELAREAVDEAMARAYAKWRTVGQLDNPAGWVFRVGLNWATSWWRKHRRETAPVGGDDHPASDATPDGTLLALAGLPLPQRAVITCRILLDLTTAETAEALGLSEGTVKSRLARGLAALRVELSTEETAS